MKITQDTMEYLEELSCMTLAEGEAVEIKAEIEEILDYIHVICDLETQGTPELISPIDAVNSWREDEVAPSLSREAFLSISSEHDGEMPIVPKVVE